MKEQSRLSVRPRLTFNKNVTSSVTVDDKDSIISKVVKLSVTVRNNGLGPAIIESGKMMDKGKVYDIPDFFDTVYPKLKDFGVFTQTYGLEAGGAIPASEIITIFTYQYNTENEKKIYDYLGSPEYYELPFIVSIEYTSLYEEKWIVESNSNTHPKKIN
ncbi:hypothetical protein QQ008_24710 [Fulvivirgaceae bacterium BMA10]|uniref:Uncharacterized protein n=1 Tax=Splendidivirga corallicola TaxID=3051826 RepID=A0ABT8KXD8_9BACT|nr:hypothetical protein [Fulvivirgaceae bacterium BMA10]